MLDAEKSIISPFHHTQKRKIVVNFKGEKKNELNSYSRFLHLEPLIWQDLVVSSWPVGFNPPEKYENHVGIG